MSTALSTAFLSVYLNPATDAINIAGDFPVPAMLEWDDVTGRLLRREEINRLPYRAELEGMPGGMLLYRLRNAKGLAKVGKVVRW